MNQKVIDQYTDFIFVEHEIEKADIIFVPGNGFPQMAQRAAKLWKEGYAPYVLPSGRFSIVTGKFGGVMAQAEKYTGDYQTEWEFLQDVLLRDGVEPEAILKEDQATYTYENAIYSRKATDQAGLDIQTAIICCKSYHARRCLLYYQLLYPDARLLICPVETEELHRGNWFQSREGIDLVLGEVERCGAQFHEILARTLLMS